MTGHWTTSWGQANARGYGVGVQRAGLEVGAEQELRVQD